MSKFLGPIHYWLHSKITQYEAFEVQMGASFHPIITEESRKKWSMIELQYNAPDPHESLENVIDQTNIHGWLQQRISRVETRVAHKVGLIKAEHPELLYSEILRLLNENAIADAHSIEESGAWNGQLDHAYKLFNNFVLEGMPCDHAGSVVESSEHTLVWQSNKCLHKHYWETVGGSVSDHYFIRDTYSKAFFKALGNIDYARVETPEGNRFELSRKGVN